MTTTHDYIVGFSSADGIFQEWATTQSVAAARLEQQVCHYYLNKRVSVWVCEAREHFLIGPVLTPERRKTDRTP